MLRGDPIIHNWSQTPPTAAPRAALCVCLCFAVAQHSLPPYSHTFALCENNLSSCVGESVLCFMYWGDNEIRSSKSYWKNSYMCFKFSRHQNTSQWFIILRDRTLLLWNVLIFDHDDQKQFPYGINFFRILNLDINSRKKCMLQYVTHYTVIHQECISSSGQHSVLHVALQKKCNVMAHFHQCNLCVVLLNVCVTAEWGRLHPQEAIKTNGYLASLCRRQNKKHGNSE